LKSSETKHQLVNKDLQKEKKRMRAFEIPNIKQYEDALQESEENFRTFMESASDLMFIIDKDANFTYLNESMARTLGYSKEEMLGMNIEKILPREKVGKKILSKIKNELITKGNFTLEQIWITKDGKKVYGKNNIIAFYDNNGKLAGSRGIFHDITERKHAEKEIKHSMDNLRKTIGGIVRTMVLTVEMRDPYTAGHQQRVANLARTIAVDMGLSKVRIEAIRIAGNIHDLGKICVPAEILSKPTYLITNNEFAIIKTHSQVGYDILTESNLPSSVDQIVLQHHERMDGSGYPTGLKGKDIILEARILAVADVVEAMASHRPYRPAHGIGTALQEIAKNRGILYDSKVVDTCLKLFTEKGFSFQSQESFYTRGPAEFRRKYFKDSTR
jgi:PAS domain S-box-containing protein